MDDGGQAERREVRESAEDEAETHGPARSSITRAEQCQEPRN